MAKVLRSDVKLDGEIIPAGTRMSKIKSTKLRDQLKEIGFFIEEETAEEPELEDEEDEDQDEEEG